MRLTSSAVVSKKGSVKRRPASSKAKAKSEKT
jgi:hypothetical protein